MVLGVKKFTFIAIMIFALLMGYIMTNTTFSILVIAGLLSVGYFLFATSYRFFVAMASIYVVFVLLFPKSGFDVSNIPITITNVLLVAVIGLFFIRSAIIRDHSIDTSYSTLKKYSFISLLYFVAMFALSILKFGVLDSAITFIPNVLPIFSALCIYMAFHNSDKLHKYYFVTFGILVFYGIVQYIFGHYATVIPGLTVNYSEYQLGDIFESKNNLTAVGLKLVATYQNGNLFAFSLIGGIIAVIGKLLSKSVTIHKNRILLTIVLILAIACITLALSRSGLIGLFLGLFAYCLFFPRILKFFIPVSAFFLIVAFWLDLDSRLFAKDLTGAGRTIQYENFWNAFLGLDFIDKVKFLLIGQGFTTTPFHASNGFFLSVVESSLLNLIFYSGIIGLILYISPLFLLIRNTVRYKKTAKRSDYIFTVSLICACIGMWGQMAIDQLLSLPPTGYLYFLFIAWGFIEVKRLRENENSSSL